jgi:outer membrane protein assembly factor BamB
MRYRGSMTIAAFFPNSTGRASRSSFSFDGITGLIPKPRRYGEPRQTALWSDKTGCCFNAFVIAPNRLLAAGHTGSGSSEKPVLAAIDITTGSDIWRETLPTAVVRAGMAVDGRGRIAVALEDGQIVAFTASEQFRSDK